MLMPFSMLFIAAIIFDAIAFFAIADTLPRLMLPPLIIFWLFSDYLFRFIFAMPCWCCHYLIIIYFLRYFRHAHIKCRCHTPFSAFAFFRWFISIISPCHAFFLFDAAYFHYSCWCPRHVYFRFMPLIIYFAIIYCFRWCFDFRFSLPLPLWAIWYHYHLMDIICCYYYYMRCRRYYFIFDIFRHCFRCFDAFHMMPRQLLMLRFLSFRRYLTMPCHYFIFFSYLCSPFSLLSIVIADAFWYFHTFAADYFRRRCW